MQERRRRDCRMAKIEVLPFTSELHYPECITLCYWILTSVALSVALATWTSMISWDLSSLHTTKAHNVLQDGVCVCLACVCAVWGGSLVLNYSLVLTRRLFTSVWEGCWMFFLTTSCRVRGVLHTEPLWAEPALGNTFIIALVFSLSSLYSFISPSSSTAHVL